MKWRCCSRIPIKIILFQLRLCCTEGAAATDATAMTVSLPLSGFYHSSVIFLNGYGKWDIQHWYTDNKVEQEQTTTMMMVEPRAVWWDKLKRGINPNPLVRNLTTSVTHTIYFNMIFYFISKNSNCECERIT